MPKHSNILSSLPVRRLEEEFRRRKARNPRYSLRAFSKTLEIAPGRLSEILAGKRNISVALGEKLCGKLALSPAQSHSFKKALSRKPPPLAEEDQYQLLEEDQFTFLAENHYTNFLALMDTKSFRSDLQWISRRLKISSVDARAMISRLKRMGLLEEEGAELVKTATNLCTTDGITSAALRQSHSQSLRHAIDCLEEVPLEDRDITSITMAIDPAQIPIAKKLIREFRFRLAELLESGERTEVFNLNIQLVPVTEKEKP